ncbi:MAG TPA: hypothetical protein VF498_10095, partial [Anaerolineales bacterium]
MIRKICSLLVLFVFAWISSGCADSVDAVTTAQDGGYEIDPAFREYYLYLGGQNTLGAGISPLILTADHGCDPTTPSTDHSREYVPLLAVGPR